MEQFINHIGEQIQFVDSRFYKAPGSEDFFPGITTILSVISKGKQFERWLMANGFNAETLAKQAMDQGSNVHSGIQEFLKGNEICWAVNDKPQYTRNEWIMISRFIDFYTAFKPKTIAVEQIIVSAKLGYGSQLDYIAEVKGELAYIDHKTGAYYPDANMQIAAGIQLWNEYFPKQPITKGYILHLESAHRGRDKKGISIQGKGWKLIPCETLQQDWEDFKAVQQIYKRKNPICKPFNLIYPDKYSIETVTEINLPDSVDEE